MALVKLSILTTLFSFIFFLFFYLNHLHAQRKINKAQSQGVEMLKELRLLLTYIQQHRGLSMGYLDGEYKLLNRIPPLEKKITQKMEQINLEYQWLKMNPMWGGMGDHWQRLVKNNTGYESQHNFKQHCNLIINLLNIIEDCAEQHHLQKLFSSNEQNSDFFWSHLLITAEYIGQVRALGTSIAAAKTVTNIQVIQLDYLQKCINTFLVKTAPQLDNTLIVNLLSTVNEQLLTSPGSISAEEFFNLATLVIDELLVKSDKYLSQL